MFYIFFATCAGCVGGFFVFRSKIVIVLFGYS